MLKSTIKRANYKLNTTFAMFVLQNTFKDIWISIWKNSTWYFLY